MKDKGMCTLSGYTCGSWNIFGFLLMFFCLLWSKRERERNMDPYPLIALRKRDIKGNGVLVKALSKIV
jgi:hypothetical protein